MGEQEQLIPPRPNPTKRDSKHIGFIVRSMPLGGAVISLAIYFGVIPLLNGTSKKPPTGLEKLDRARMARAIANSDQTMTYMLRYKTLDENHKMSERVFNWNLRLPNSLNLFPTNFGHPDPATGRLMFPDYKSGKPVYRYLYKTKWQYLYTQNGFKKSLKTRFYKTPTGDWNLRTQKQDNREVTPTHKSIPLEKMSRIKLDHNLYIYSMLLPEAKFVDAKYNLREKTKNDPNHHLTQVRIENTNYLLEQEMSGPRPTIGKSNCKPGQSYHGLIELVDADGAPKNECSDGDQVFVKSFTASNDLHISCRSYSVLPVKLCKTSFSFHGWTVRIEFKKPMLKNWKEILVNVKTTLESVTEKIDDLPDEGPVTASMVFKSFKRTMAGVRIIGNNIYLD